jgi:hypothetical protein
MRQVTMILGVVAVVLALGGVASATLLDNFESGYTDGITVDGQNGWSNVYGGGDTVSSTAGVGGGWGLVNDVNTNSWSESGKAVGVDATPGSSVVAQFDIKQTGLPGGGWTMQEIILKGAGGMNLQFSIDNNNNVPGNSAFRIGAYAFGGNFNDIQAAAGYATGDWMHVKLTWNLGTDINVHVTDASNNVLWDHSHATTDVPASFDSITFGSIQSSTSLQNAFYFDNINVANVPEPSTLALLTAGAIGLLCYAWRKRR